MPVGVIEFVSTADRLPVLGYSLAGVGKAIGMTAVVTVGFPEKGQLLVEAGIMSGGRGETFKVAVLLREYVYLGRPGHWNGNLDLEPGYEFYLEIRAAEVYRVRLNYMTRVEG